MTQRTALDPYAKEARRQYRLMARSLEIDALLASTRGQPITERVCHKWAVRLRMLSQTEGEQ